MQARPNEITIQRAEEAMHIKWSDGAVGEYPLRWLRANCPCATCKELRRQATTEVDSLQLNVGPSMEPSTQIAQAELVGNYAIRLEWTDGHGTGIFGFNSLHKAVGLEKTDANGVPLLNFQF